jgi:antirestriction protein ArdC
MATQTEIREQITNRIVDSLKAGTAPWRRPWSDLANTGHPANVVSKRSYSGVNPLLLQLIAAENGWSSRWWGTFRQWADLGFRIKARPSNVRPGEWGTRVVFCKAVTKKPAHERGDVDQNAEASERESRFFLLRTYCVFNAQQVEGDGIEKYLAQPRTTTTFEDHAPAEEVVAATGARIEYGGSKALYFPEQDFILLPQKEAFTGVQEFYATAFHELGHWTGHQSRLARLDKNSRFGSHAYAVEELVAEMAGCFLCNEVGVPQSTNLDNQAAYLASWLAVLKADPSAIFTAASQASAAVDFVLRFSRKNEDAAGAGEENEATAARVAG